MATPTYEFFTPSPILAGVEAAVNAANISMSEYQEAERAKQQYQRFADVLESQGFEGDALAHRALADGIRPNFSKAIREKKTSDFGLSKLNENMLNVFAQERKNDALAQRQQNQIDAVNARTEFGAQNRQASSFANSALQSARGFESQAATARRNAARARGNGEEAEALQFDEEAYQLEQQAESARQEARRYRGSAPSSIGGSGTFGGVDVSSGSWNAAPSVFGGPNDPVDNGRSAFGGRTGPGGKEGVAIPQKILQQFYGDDRNAWANAKVEVTTEDGRKRVMDVVDLGTAEWVWRRQGGAVQDFTPGAIRELGGSVTTNSRGQITGVSGLGNVQVRLLPSGIQGQQPQQAGQPTETPVTNTRLENTRKAALSSGLVRNNPERVKIISGSQSASEINDLLNQWEREVRLGFSANRDERADRSELRADQRARNQARTTAFTFSDFSDAQAEANRISPQLEVNQYPRIGGFSGAWKVGIGYVDKQEVYEAADGSRVIIDGSTVIRNNGDGWVVTNLTPADARRALKGIEQYNPAPNTRAAVPPAVPTAESPAALPTQSSLNTKQGAGNIIDGWLKQRN